MAIGLAKTKGETLAGLKNLGCQSRTLFLNNPTTKKGKFPEDKNPNNLDVICGE